MGILLVGIFIHPDATSPFIMIHRDATCFFIIIDLAPFQENSCRSGSQ